MSEEDLNKIRDLAKLSSPEVIKYVDLLWEKEVQKLEGYAERNWGAIKKLVKYTVLILSILTIGLLITGIFSIKLSSENNILSKGTYGSCHRLNIVRAVDNENDYVNYILFKSILELFKKASKKAINSEEKFDRELFIHPLENNVNREEWIPLTNCILAIHNPFTYTPPEPINFSKQKPSYYAFHLGPDN